MGFQPIPNQPIVFESDYQPCLNNDDTQYAALYQPGDLLQLQWKQTPCSTAMDCPTDGAELILNGDFATNLSDWTAGAGWTWNTGTAEHTGAQTDLETTVAIALAIGWYKLTIRIADIGFYDSCKVSVGGTIVIPELLGATAIPGVYTGYYYESAGASRVVTITAGVDVRVANISLVSTWTCFDEIPADDWIISDGRLTHVSGNLTQVQATGLLFAGIYYQIKIQVLGMTGGSLSVFTGDGFHLAGTISTNGTYTFYRQSGGVGDVILIPTTAFDGGIVYIQIYEMSNDTSIALYQDGVLASVAYDSANTDYPVLYYKDWVMWSAPISGILEAPLGDPIGYGCYNVGVTSSCDAETYLSENQISYKETQDCSVLVNAYNDTGENLGFYFGSDYSEIISPSYDPANNDQFTLSQRLRLLRISPVHTIKGDDYIDSAGSNQKVSAMVDKIYEAWFDYVNDITHDCIAVQIACKNFTLDDVEYFPPIQNYEPEWQPNQKRNLAQSRIQLKKKNSVLFNRNCSQ